MYAARFTNEEHANVFYAMIQAISTICRFKFVITQFQRAEKHFVRFETIRLKESKSYCGNHAGPCQINPAFEKPHRKSNCLEGSDWVAFNDMINDVIDLMGVDAWVSSSTCIIRIADMRCVEYKGKDGGKFEKVGYYEKTEPTKAKYPDGTPGIDTWRN